MTISNQIGEEIEIEYHVGVWILRTGYGTKVDEIGEVGDAVDMAEYMLE
ncbi:hypothetical protein ACFQE1_01755 [Halobium palmae]|uniref:Uncharacterized protein n=1 Tax=Halobium palmae TaxID=1776492 RepID=A0ABD5RUN2_9EURY